MSPSIPAIALAFAAIASPLIAGCATADSSNKDPAAIVSELGDVTDLTGRHEVTIEATDNSYRPVVIKVSPGTKVSVRNTGANPHTVTPFDDTMFAAVSVTPAEAKAFDAPMRPGSYPFYCTLHGSRTGGQRGALVVAPI